jgi:Ca-activated chloride channel homolog
MTSVDFLSPYGLWLLLLPVVLLAGYLWSLRRRNRYALRFSSVSLVREAMGKGPGWRRHIPPVFFLLGITALAVAFARPNTTAPLPFNGATVILTMDVSGSMRADDLKPSRFEASKAAARAFIEKQSPTTRIGIVSFAGGASLVQPPTIDHDLLFTALDRLNTQRSTAIGAGILTSLDAIAEALNLDLPSTSGMIPSVQSPRGAPAAPTAQPMPKGTYAPAIMVLLTDGQNTTGPLPVDAAKIAVDRGVRIYTVGVGTVAGATIGGGFGGGGGFFRATLDEVTLRQVAKMTDAKYFYAANESDLTDIYRSLDSSLIIKPQQFEVTGYVTMIGAAFLMLGGLASLFWFSRLP